MNGHNHTLDGLKRLAVIAIDRSELQPLLERSRLVREINTHISGWIRIIHLDGAVILQEETPEGEVLLRRFDSEEQANAFIDDRLATYERMWDGCGCRIDYHADKS